MVMLQKWSLYWRENGHVTDVSVLWRENGYFTEVLTLMGICIFHCILWSILVFCFWYTVYLTFKSPHLPLPLHQCFPPHCKIFAYRGNGDFMPAKIEQVCQAQKGNDILTNVWESMSACHSLSIKWSCYGGGQFNGERMVLQRWSV